MPLWEAQVRLWSTGAHKGGKVASLGGNTYLSRRHTCLIVRHTWFSRRHISLSGRHRYFTESLSGRYMSLSEAHATLGGACLCHKTYIILT